MEEISDNKTSFVISNKLYMKTLYLDLGMAFVVFIFLTTLFFNIHILVKIFILIVYFVIFLFRIREELRTTNMIIDNDKLVIGIEEIKASEIEEIIYSTWIIDVKCKNRRSFRKYVRIYLRDNKELDQFKSCLNEFGKRNDINIRIAY